MSNRPHDVLPQMGDGFRAMRVTRSFEHRVAAPPSEVFPLLCPVREGEWLPGWACDIVYLASGRAERSGVFATDLPGRGRGMWVISRYEPLRAIGFVVFYPDAYVEQLDVTLEPDGDDATRVCWTRVYTGTTDCGNLQISETTGSLLDQRMLAQLNALERLFERPMNA